MILIFSLFLVAPMVHQQHDKAQQQHDDINVIVTSHDSDDNDPLHHTSSHLLKFCLAPKCLRLSLTFTCNTWFPKLKWLVKLRNRICLI